MTFVRSSAVGLGLSVLTLFVLITVSIGKTIISALTICDRTVGGGIRIIIISPRGGRIPGPIICLLRKCKKGTGA